MHIQPLASVAAARARQRLAAKRSKSGDDILWFCAVGNDELLIGLVQRANPLREAERLGQVLALDLAALRFDAADDLQLARRDERGQVRYVADAQDAGRQ